VSCSDVGNDRTLNVFLQDPYKQHSINSVMVSSGWAQATGVGSVIAEFYHLTCTLLYCPVTFVHPV